MLPFAVIKQSEENNIAKLTSVVEEAITMIASAARLSNEQMLELLKESSIAELRLSKRALGGLFGPSKFRKALDRGIKAIAYATDLNTTQISAVFTAQKQASFADVVRRLREQSKSNRFVISHY